MEIRKIYAGGGETYLSLSEKYDVCLKTIQQIILFKTWRYSI